MKHETDTGVYKPQVKRKEGTVPLKNTALDDCIKDILKILKNYD